MLEHNTSFSSKCKLSFNSAMEHSLQEQQCVNGAKSIQQRALATAHLPAPNWWLHWNWWWCWLSDRNWPNWRRWLRATDFRTMSLTCARCATRLGLQTRITSLKTPCQAGLEEQVPALLRWWFWLLHWSWPDWSWRWFRATNIVTIRPTTRYPWSHRNRAMRATRLGLQTLITSWQTLCQAGLEEQVPTLFRWWFWLSCWNWPSWSWRWLRATDFRAMSLRRARRATRLGLQTLIAPLQTLCQAGLEEHVPTLGRRWCWPWSGP